MYFFYFDESGSRDPKAFEIKPAGAVQAKDHIYSLTSIGLWEGNWRTCVPTTCIVRLKQEISPFRISVSCSLTITNARTDRKLMA